MTIGATAGPSCLKRLRHQVEHHAIVFQGQAALITLNTHRVDRLAIVRRAFIQNALHKLGHFFARMAGNNVITALLIGLAPCMIG